MSKTPRILAFAGSTRLDSFNRKLVALAAAAAREQGAEVTLLDLRDYRLPLYDAELEAESGLPLEAVEMKRLFVEHEGLLIASPEYNSSITPLLKNTLDWVSRPAPGEPGLAAFRAKTAVLMAASPGALGGLRGLVTVRSILGNVGVIVLPEQVAVPRAHEAFDQAGNLTDPGQAESIASLGRRLATFLSRSA